MIIKSYITKSVVKHLGVYTGKKYLHATVYHSNYQHLSNKKDRY